MAGKSSGSGEGAGANGGKAAFDGTGAKGSLRWPCAEGDRESRWYSRLVEGQRSECAAGRTGELGRSDDLRHDQAVVDAGDEYAGLSPGAHYFVDLRGTGGGDNGNAGGCGEDASDEPAV